MVRCTHCGAENYAIDMWCSNCSHHLDWAPATTPAPSPTESAQAAAPEPEAAAVPAPPQPLAAAEPEPVAEPRPEVVPVAVAATAGGPRSQGNGGARSRRRPPVWILPFAAALVVALLLAMPVLGWFKAAGQHDTAQLPLTGVKSSASASPAPSATADATPAPTADPTPAPTDQPAAQPAIQPAPVPPPANQQPASAPPPAPAAQSGAGDPTGAIAAFYHDVAAHQFDAAASTWSARMQSAYPPPEFINHRFAYTQQMNLRQAEVVANNGQTATVYIDLIEVYAGSTRHWVGTWQLVETSSGWLLNQPNLRAAG